MTFGLRNAAQTFQRFLNSILGECCYNYIDDILSSLHAHVGHIKAVFERLSAHGMVLNVSKSKFAKEMVDFLGYTIFKGGVRPTADRRVEAISGHTRDRKQLNR